jgi:ribose 5-phosphate isomerase A
MNDPTVAAKRRAAEQAVQLVESGMIVGLGTGSTAAFAVEAIGKKLQGGELKHVRAVPTSTRTLKQADAVGIPLTSLNEDPRLDLTIDGADEVDPDGNLIKGGGGALLWEKIVATASSRYVIVVDETKLVERLGRAFPLPVEVVPFGWRTHLEPMTDLGAEPSIRMRNDGKPYRTDEGHFIIDCKFAGGIADPADVHDRLRCRPGVVETGLFLGFDPHVIVGRA